MVKKNQNSEFSTLTLHLLFHICVQKENQRQLHRTFQKNRIILGLHLKGKLVSLCSPVV